MFLYAMPGLVLRAVVAKTTLMVHPETKPNADIQCAGKSDDMQAGAFKKRE